jgi:hypothetical protein
MPFDGIDSLGNDQLTKLGAVQQLLATEQQWCKGRLRDAQGRHCLVGAIEAVEGRQMLQRVVLQAAREVSGRRYWRIEFFNDDPHTTHADVRAVLRRARESIIDGMICDPQPWHRRWARGLMGLFSPAADGGAVSGESGRPSRRPHQAYPAREQREERPVVLELQGR